MGLRLSLVEAGPDGYPGTTMPQIHLPLPWVSISLWIKPNDRDAFLVKG